MKFHMLNNAVVLGDCSLLGNGVSESDLHSLFIQKVCLFSEGGTISFIGKRVSLPLCHIFDFHRGDYFFTISEAVRGLPCC